MCYNMKLEAMILKKNMATIFILLLLVIIYGFTIKTIYRILSNNNTKIKYLNDIIKSNRQRDGEKSYLTIKSMSNIFAKDNKNGYYFVSDGEYNYIVYLDDNKAKELFEKDLENEPVKLYGLVKNTNNNIKKIAVEKYNYGLDDDKKINIKDFYSYFGNVYLDLVNVK